MFQNRWHDNEVLPDSEKAPRFYFRFCSGPASEDEKIHSERDLMHSSSVARPEDPLVCPLLIRETRRALVNFRLACNMVWGGARAGNSAPWLLTSISLPVREDDLCWTSGPGVSQQLRPADAVSDQRWGRTHSNTSLPTPCVTSTPCVA